MLTTGKQGGVEHPLIGMCGYAIWQLADRSCELVAT
jgi:hypothetical protein